MTDVADGLLKHRLAFRRYSDAPHDTGLYPWEDEDEIDGYPDGKSGGPYYSHDVVISALAAIEDENELLRKSLSDAAMEINCAGPVVHRIRILKKEHEAALAAEYERGRREMREEAVKACGFVVEEHAMIAGKDDWYSGVTAGAEKCRFKVADIPDKEVKP